MFHAYNCPVGIKKNIGNLKTILYKRRNGIDSSSCGLSSIWKTAMGAVMKVLVFLVAALVGKFYIKRIVDTGHEASWTPLARSLIKREALGKPR